MSIRPLPQRNKIPWWAQVSAVTGPAMLFGAWLLAGEVDLGDDPGGLELSDLATSPGWWLTPAAVTVTGVAYIVTAGGLRPAAPTGRQLLAAGGALTILSGWLPVLGRPGFWHTTITNLALVTLCVWPALISPDRPYLPLVLRRRFDGNLTIGLGALLLLCVMTGMDVVGGATYGPQERLLMTVQALAPLVVILGVQLHPAAVHREVAPHP